MSDLELLITGTARTCELESSDGQVSIGGSIEHVVANAVPLLRAIVAGGRSCSLVSYVSLGWRRTEALKTTGATCKVDLAGAYRRRNAQAPSKRWQMPGAAVPESAAPTYQSWEDYLSRTTRSERMTRCHAASKKANRKRLLSDGPAKLLTGQIVWGIIEAARGQCAYCGSLAVEKRPSKFNGAPAAWAQVGRRIGSLEHSKARLLGGDNFIENLAWSCLWCNTWPSERRLGATDHGGYHPAQIGL
jgi:hypothetical protein